MARTTNDLTGERTALLNKVDAMLDRAYTLRLAAQGDPVAQQMVEMEVAARAAARNDGATGEFAPDTDDPWVGL